MWNEEGKGDEGKKADGKGVSDATKCRDKAKLRTARLPGLYDRVATMYSLCRSHAILRLLITFESVGRSVSVMIKGMYETHTISRS